MLVGRYAKTINKINQWFGATSWYDLTYRIQMWCVRFQEIFTSSAYDIFEGTVRICFNSVKDFLVAMQNCLYTILKLWQGNAKNHLVKLF